MFWFVFQRLTLRRVAVRLMGHLILDVVALGRLRTADHLQIATGNLDPQFAQDILALWESINRSGTAILMATHNYDLIRQYPHRTLVLENGRLSREIPPEDLD